MTEAHAGTFPREAPSSRPLDGVRVLELGNYIAAPTAGRLLADFGAEVIKIERPRTGDEVRKWRLYAGETSMLYRTLNRGKKSVELDLSSSANRDALLALVRQSDVLIENFRPGTLDRWGLGASVLSIANPELIVARISAFGQTGPLAHRPGFAAVAEAYGGLRELVGEPDRPSSRVGVSIGDSVAGLYAAFGVVMSLFDREGARSRGTAVATPEDRHVDVALSEAVLSMMESLIPDYSAHGVLRRRMGGRIEGIAPSNAYVCGDGSSIVIAGNGDSIFRRLMTTVGRQDLADDSELSSSGARRWELRDMLDEAVADWARTQTRGAALHALEASGVPAGPIHTARDIVSDSQFAARNMLQDLDVEVDGTIRRVTFPGIVPLLGDQSYDVLHPGPDLGAHTNEVMRSLVDPSREGH